jgi:FAD/FMN-containing dehydrogenase
MSKVAEYLQDHITGEVVIAPEILEHFSTDASIFKIIPQIIEYPRIEDDIRKTARFTWQLAERGKVIPITARGLGTDQGGAAIGSGIVMIFPAHMNKVLSLNSKKGLVTVQPGVNYGRLEQTLQTHGQFIPPYPTSVEYSTIGGAICNNAGGEKTLKYGSTKDYVRSLRVVLANGDLITTSRLSKRELNKKKSQADMEGEIYRAVDGLICDNTKLLDDNRIFINNNNAGYDLWSVKQPDGSFDLTPLFVGSQGTLGIVSEATLETEPYNPQSSLIVGFFDNIENTGEAINKIRKFQPCSLEIVDGNLLASVEKNNPNQLKRSEKPFDKLVLFVEFDDYKDRHQKKNIKKTKKILEQLARSFQYAADREEQEELWKIRHSASSIISHSVGNKKALPIIEDGSVPQRDLQNYYKKYMNFLSILV